MGEAVTRPDVDWESIGRDYRAGVKTLRKMGEEYGVTEGAIRKRAKRDRWPRDLTERIEQRTQELVRRQAVRSLTSCVLDNPEDADPLPLPITPTEVEVIEANAQLRLITQVSQRKDITRYRNLASKLYAELEAQTCNPEEFERMFELATMDMDIAVSDLAKMQEMYRKVLTSPQRIDSFKKLTETLKTLIGLERQAVGLSDNANGEGDNPKPPPDSEDVKDAAKRIAFVLAQTIQVGGTR